MFNMTSVMCTVTIDAYMNAHICKCMCLGMFVRERVDIFEISPIVKGIVIAKLCKRVGRKTINSKINFCLIDFKL